jgi:hypothetical protein
MFGHGQLAALKEAEQLVIQQGVAFPLDELLRVVRHARSANAGNTLHRLHMRRARVLDCDGYPNRAPQILVRPVAALRVEHQQ